MIRMPFAHLWFTATVYDIVRMVVRSPNSEMYAKVNNELSLGLSFLQPHGMVTSYGEGDCN